MIDDVANHLVGTASSGRPANQQLEGSSKSFNLMRTLEVETCEEKLKKRPSSWASYT